MAQIYAKLLVLDDSGNVSYTGNSSNSLYVWGAQLELGQYFTDSASDYHNYRYIRTTGADASFIGVRFGQDPTTDQAPITDSAKYIYGKRFGTYENGSVKDSSDINTVYNQGFLRMTNYVSIDYIAEDYVGESRVLTY